MSPGCRTTVIAPTRPGHASGALIAASLGTLLGFLAAHFRRATESLILMAIDFQASMPFMIIALSVLAFLGNSLPLFVAGRRAAQPARSHPALRRSGHSMPR